jgi:hypothetical protein
MSENKDVYVRQVGPSDRSHDETMYYIQITKHLSDMHGKASTRKVPDLIEFPSIDETQPESAAVRMGRMIDSAPVMIAHARKLLEVESHGRLGGRTDASRVTRDDDAGSRRASILCSTRRPKLDRPKEIKQRHTRHSSVCLCTRTASDGGRTWRSPFSSI